MCANITCPPIHIRGRFFWQGDNRFIVRGVAYQVRSTLDPISDDRLTELKDDILLFKELGLNTLFVYCIDNTKDHTQAMKLLKEAGIYVFTTVSTPSKSINRLAPNESYNPDTMASFFKTVDTMAKFPNTLGLLAANELINNDATLPVAPVLKAVVRDLKKYMKLQNSATGQRILPIGYNGATSNSRDHEVLEYLTTGDDSSSIDFWTFKNYDTGYNDLLQHFLPTTIPIFISEYGNISHQPRLFHETTALYAPATCRVFSGGCVYEFWQGANGYGLVEMVERGKDAGYESRIYERRERVTRTVFVFRDFVEYKARLAEVGSVGREDDGEIWGGGKEEGERASKQSWQAELRVPESCVDWERIMR